MKQPITKIVLSICLLFLYNAITAQISFSNKSNLLPNIDFHSGVPIAVVDMNNDGIDDIVRLGNGRMLTIEFQHADGTFSTMDVVQVSGERQWSICVADIDNNGYNDVLTGGYDEVKIIKANGNGTAYNMSYLPGSYVPGYEIFSQGSNFVDIDNDGWVDIFVCDDDAESRIWKNNAGASFEIMNEWIDMVTVPTSDNSGNYGSVWTDFDNDGDLDLYIAKCRQGSNNPDDPRRINALFVNDGNNNFTEEAETYGLKIGWQSWTADFQDIDNDGDMDCFVTNHDEASQLLLNDGAGYFTDISAGAGINVMGLAIQGVMRDFDNDGFVDILVSGSVDHLFMNNGDLSFTEVTGVFGDNEIHSYALGDLNADGFVDVYAGYAGIFNNPSNTDDVLWINDGNDNNHFTVRLIGTESNTMGIGSRVEIYGEWGMQIREVRSGESYGIMNSLNQYFGLGNHAAIDSVIVKWPSGTISHIPNPEINTMVTIIEDACLAPSASVTPSGSTTICTGESVILSASEGYAYLWSNGATTQEIEVTETGTHIVTITDETGCYGVAQSVIVRLNPDETPIIAASGNLDLCVGETVAVTLTVSAPLIASDVTNYTWSTGAGGQSIEVMEPGVYNVMIQGVCEEFTSEPVDVSVLALPVAPIVADVTINGAQSATLENSGDILYWYDAPVDGNLLGIGNTFETPVLEETTSFYAQDANYIGGGIVSAGVTDNALGGGENPATFNGWLIFDAYEKFTLHSVKLYAYGDGERTIQLVNNDDEILEEAVIFVPGGERRVYLNFQVPAGNNHILRTATDPSMYRINDGLNYPYPIGNVGEIQTSRYGQEYYYYFYDWEVDEAELTCYGAFTEVTVTVEPSSIKGLGENTVNIFPNPGHGLYTLNTDFTSDVSLRVLSLDGKKVVYEKMIPADAISSYDLDLQHLPDGMYLLQVEGAEGVGLAKLVKL